MKRVTFNEDAPLAPHGRAPKLLGADTGPRTDYHCVAHGCPNAASIDDDMARGGPRGKCYWHWKADPKDWPDVTERILNNFTSMCNHDRPGLEPMPRSPYAEAVLAGKFERRRVSPEDGE